MLRVTWVKPVALTNGAWMTTSQDRTGETGIDVAAGIHRDVVTRQVCRGVGRLMRALGLASINELPLPNGRRADVVALSASGDIWIIEVKSSVEDLRADQKWPEYREFSDQLYFAVAPEFPVDILPADAGLILADRFGGEIVRPAPEARLSAARRKSMTLRFARAAALALHTAVDPSHENS
jgi:hypothetical protein